MNQRYAAALLTLTVVLSSARAQELPIITVAMIAPLTGPIAGIGKEIRDAASLTLVQARLEFRKLGFDLRLKSFDDKGDDAQARQQAQLVIADPYALVVVGAVNSGATIPASEVLAPARLGMVSPSSTNPKVTDRGLKNINRIVARDDDQGPAGANFILDTLNLKNVYVVDDASVYGKGLAEQVIPLFKSRGATVVGSSSSTERKSMKALVDAIVASKAQAVYFGGQYDLGGPLVKALRAAGSRVEFVGADSLQGEDFKKLAGPSAKGVFFTATVAPPASYTSARAFSESFRKRYSSEVTGFGILGYDAMNVALIALKDAIRLNEGKLPSRIQVETALRKVKAPKMLTGDIRFNSKGDRDSATIFVLQIGDDLNSRVNSAIRVKSVK